MYIRTCARTHARTRTRSIANSTRKRTQTHARKRTRTQINARKLIVAIDAWAICACKRDCILRVRSKIFRMYYTCTYIAYKWDTAQAESTSPRFLVCFALYRWWPCITLSRIATVFPLLTLCFSSCPTLMLYVCYLAPVISLAHTHLRQHACA